MSKAEDRALQEYPKITKRYRKLGDTEENTGSEYDENLEQRCIYIKGYHQAEKDLELTWEDIPKIFQISEELKTSWWFRDNEQTKLIGTQPFWEEVLKRFKENRY